MTDLSGNFRSPYYPSGYPNHLDCNWDITVTPGSYMYLLFSTFNLQHDGKHCPFEYVEVSDSDYPLGSIKIKRCGYQSPWCVFSTRNVLHVRFVTDSTVSASGFVARYKESSDYYLPDSGVTCLSLEKIECK